MTDGCVKWQYGPEFNLFARRASQKSRHLQRSIRHTKFRPYVDSVYGAAKKKLYFPQGFLLMFCVLIIDHYQYVSLSLLDCFLISVSGLRIGTGSHEPAN